VELAEDKGVGLPRSSLVKSKSVVVAPVAVPVVASPAPVASFVPAPVWTAAVPDVFGPTVVAAPAPLAAPAAELPPAPPAVVAEPAVRETFDTKADSIEIQVESQRAPALPARVAPPLPNDVMRAPYASGPSSSELLERAAALGPARMTWESIVLPSDPILDEKRQPHVAERRARLTRVVKIALGACVGLCVLALGASAISGGDSSSAAAATATSVGKTVASKGVVPVEQLEATRHAKAVRRTAPVVTTAAIVRGPKRR
jgi:hypothetical protein